MRFVTDRTWADVLAGTEKGRYTTRDLDRVEQAVEYLGSFLPALGISLELTTCTQWSKTRKMPTRESMERYLQNVRGLCACLGLEPELPDSMERLTYQDANRIELALEQAEKRLEQLLGDYQMRKEQ